MNNKYTIISYYKFTKIKNIFKYKNILNNKFKNLDIKGIILLAPEVSYLKEDLRVTQAVALVFLIFHARAGC